LYLFVVLIDAFVERKTTMEDRPAFERLATTSLILGIAGWTFYLFQWCFDLTLGWILAAVSGGLGGICSVILDFLPFLLWLTGLVTGHVALGRAKGAPFTGRRRAVWGLVLNYSGLIIMILSTVVLIALVAAGVGWGVFDKLLPSFPKH
jgi:hypothetical protein